MIYDVTLHIFIKPAVLNPEEKPIAGALRNLGFTTVKKIKMGKCHIVSLEADDENQARTKVEEMGNKLLTNPITEAFHIETVKEVGI